jgi:GH15 family glucan-1,4-alpha-glucosidase
VGEQVSPDTEPTTGGAQSAAMPSPFPPIADYAFLSDCHTGALIAPDGAVDWLCIPRFDSPSVFGSLLDRQAGSFRFGPFGINVPTQVAYEPGTNVLVTTWKTPSGWVVVRDALTMGARQGADTVTPHTRPPADDDADHMLVRTVQCLEGQVEIELVCEPIFDYGQVPATWSLADGNDGIADATGGDQMFRLATDLSLGIEGDRVRARHHLNAGDRAYCALSWAHELETPSDVDDAEVRIAATVRFWRTWLDRARVRVSDQGTHVHAHGRDRGGADDIAARDPRRGTQLGLPVHLDPGFDVHPSGPALPQSRLGGGGVHAVRGRPGAEHGRRVADHVRDRRSS